MTEVDYGGGGHRTRLKDQLINLCVYGVPPSFVYKGVEEGEGPALLGAPKGRPNPIGSRTPTLPRVGVGDREGGERGKERGRRPLLVQFGL